MDHTVTIEYFIMQILIDMSCLCQTRKVGVKDLKWLSEAYIHLKIVFM